MQILQTIPYFNPRFGGDVKVCSKLSQLLFERGHDVSILTTDYEFDSSFANSHDVDIHTVNCEVNFKKFFYSPNMKSWIKQYGDSFDIIHSHQYRTYQNIILNRFFKGNGVPYIIHPHGSVPRKTEKQRLKRLYDIFVGKEIIREAAGVIAVSEMEANYSIEYGANPSDVKTLYNGMDITAFQDLPQFRTFKERYEITGPMILFLGRLHKAKGLDMLIEAFASFKTQSMDATLVIAGSDDGYEGIVKEKITEFGLQEHVLLTGFLSEQQKLAALNDADVFIHTVDYMGGVGLTPLEAILCGTPVIVTEQCGEVIKQANAGYFVTPGKPNELKNQIEYVLSNTKQADKKVENGRHFIHQNLTWESRAAIVEEYYREKIRN